MSGMGRRVKETRAVKIRTTEGQRHPEAQLFGSLPGAGVGAVRVAIVEGGLDAIGGSFPSCSLLPISRLELSDSKLRKPMGQG